MRILLSSCYKINISRFNSNILSKLRTLTYEPNSFAVGYKVSKRGICDKISKIVAALRSIETRTF